MGPELSIVPWWWLTLTGHQGRRQTVPDSPIWSEPREVPLRSALKAPSQQEATLLRCEVKSLGSRAQPRGGKNGIYGKTKQSHVCKGEEVYKMLHIQNTLRNEMLSFFCRENLTLNSTPKLSVRSLHLFLRNSSTAHFWGKGKFYLVHCACKFHMPS